MTAPPPVLLAPTITKLPPEAEGAVVVSGSHGGRYPGHLAARAGVRAAVFNDAGVGLDGAGIGALPYLQALGIAAAAVGHASCRIGDTDDAMARGVISRANDLASALGVQPGLSARDAAERLRGAAHRRAEPPAVGEARGEVPVQGACRRLLLLDSASLVRPGDAGHVVVTGSHGGLVGGDPAAALRVDAFAAAFNDAGGGPDGAGTSRLPALDRRGIAAIAVAAGSARIGEARSTFADGIVSAANAAARARGAREGDRAEPLLREWASG